MRRKLHIFEMTSTNEVILTTTFTTIFLRQISYFLVYMDIYFLRKRSRSIHHVYTLEPVIVRVSTVLREPVEITETSIRFNHSPPLRYFVLAVL